MAKITIAIPFHWMDNWQFFLSRCLKSIELQTFKDYEVVLMKVDSMPITSNRVLEAAKGDFIKILYMDDYFAHEGALQAIVEAFDEDTHWVATGCLHQSGSEEPHSPHYSVCDERIKEGVNTIGSPSVIAVRNNGHLLFDEKMTWMLDVDLYKRYLSTYGYPRILDDLNVVIGLGKHQMTNKLSNEEKTSEIKLFNEKYA